MPNRLARSVSASAGMPSAAARSMAASRRVRPSVIEYSLCRRRWTKAGAGMARILPAAPYKAHQRGAVASTRPRRGALRKAAPVKALRAQSAAVERQRIAQACADSAARARPPRRNRYGCQESVWRACVRLVRPPWNLSPSSPPWRSSPPCPPPSICALRFRTNNQALNATRGGRWPPLVVCGISRRSPLLVAAVAERLVLAGAAAAQPALRGGRSDFAEGVAHG